MQVENRNVRSCFECVFVAGRIHAVIPELVEELICLEAEAPPGADNGYPVSLVACDQRAAAIITRPSRDRRRQAASAERARQASHASTSARGSGTGMPTQISAWQKL